MHTQCTIDLTRFLRLVFHAQFQNGNKLQLNQLYQIYQREKLDTNPDEAPVPVPRKINGAS